MDMMTQHLRDLGYEVRAEGDSMAALETIRTASAPFDLLITDLSMPRLSGLELSTAIRRIRPAMRVIVCTGSADPQDLTIDPANGISAVVLKPIDFVELSRTIHRILSTQPHPPQPIP